MFTVQLNNHLKDLKGSKDDFGGVSSIITFGDLFQLKVAPYGFDCVEHNHVQKFIIF